MRRPLLAYGVGLVATLFIATTAFVRHRNREHAARALEHGRSAAEAVADGREPYPPVLAKGVIEHASASPKYSFLHRRVVRGEGRQLGGPEATPEDKLLADAAAAAERDGAFARFLDDDSGRVLAARPLADGRAVAVVLARPLSAPAPFPWLVIGGLTLFGALIAWLAPKLLGLALSALAVPAAVWGGPVAAIAILLVAASVAYADARGHVAAARKSAARHRIAYAYLAPAAAGMAILVVVPFVVGCVLGFFDHSRGEWQFVGWKNFQTIFSGGGRSFDDPLNFWYTLVVTLAWTTINVALHVTIGVILALALRERWMRARGLFRVLLILPWAIPNYITALIWRGMFQQQYGAVNALLAWVGLGRVAWFSKFSTAFAANVTTNTWLGFPFMMVVALGALQSIPRDLYEAAAVDGAGPWQRFVAITLPNLRPALLPAVILGSIWTFNMFNVIYLVSGGKPAGATDILVTQAYRWAFERGQKYGMAAAYATIIFLILVVWTLVANRLTREAKA